MSEEIKNDDPRLIRPGYHPATHERKSFEAPSIALQKKALQALDGSDEDFNNFMTNLSIV